MVDSQTRVPALVESIRRGDPIRWMDNGLYLTKRDASLPWRTVRQSAQTVTFCAQVPFEDGIEERYVIVPIEALS